jgi:GNAT superfamily N-acetyltransferase
MTCVTQLIQCTKFHDLAGFDEVESWPRITAVDWDRERPDAHWRLMGGNDTTLARLSLWWSRVASYSDARLGYIGHYAALNEVAGVHLLRHALGELKHRGATLAIGPIDGSTWQRYRLITEAGIDPPFLFDLQHPLDWPQHFVASGFASFSGYRSTLCEDLAARPDSMTTLEARLIGRRGIHVRPLDMTRLREDLSAIYRLLLVSFQHQLLFTPVSEAAFLEQYSSVLRSVDPSLVLLAEHESTIAGFVFCVPDHLQRERGAVPDTVIIKTLAVAPAARYSGLGIVLTRRVQNQAHELGYRRAIHAMMRDTGKCGRMSEERHGARLVRRYVLFGQEIA